MARGAADLEGAAMNKIHARKDNELDKKVEGIAAEGDEVIKMSKAKLKELEVATGLLADAYKPWSGARTPSSLQTAITSCVQLCDSST